MFEATTVKKALGLAIALTLATAASGSAVAQALDFDRSRVPSALVGSWRVVVTPYVCTTGAPLPLFARSQMITFGDGGTVVEASGSPDFQPGQRSSGHGYWERTGQQSFRAVLEAYILFTSVVTPPATPRYQRGMQRFDHGIEMQDADHWSSYLSVTFFDLSGTAVPPSGCAQATGERMN